MHALEDIVVMSHMMDIVEIYMIKEHIVYGQQVYEHLDNKQHLEMKEEEFVKVQALVKVNVLVQVFKEVDQKLVERVVREM